MSSANAERAHGATIGVASPPVIASRCVRGLGGEVEILSRHQRAGAAVLVAASEGAWLLVVGTRGLGGFRWMLTGKGRARSLLVELE